MMNLFEALQLLKEGEPNINHKGINYRGYLYDTMQKYTNEETYVSFNDLFNCYSLNELQDLYDYLSSEYEDEEIGSSYRNKLNNSNDMWDAMNELMLPKEQEVSYDDLFNCFSLTKLQKLYNYLSDKYSDIDDLEEFENKQLEEFENKQLNESNNIDDDRKRIKYIVDIVNSLDNHLNTVNEISDSLSKKIAKLYNMCSFLECIDEIKESTSGIGGAYTTKSIDIKPE